LDEAIRNLEIPVHIVEWVYNGVDPRTFDIKRSAASSAIRAEFNIPASAKVGAIVGNIVPHKGQLVLIEAICRVVRTAPDLVFLITSRCNQMWWARGNDR